MRLKSKGMCAFQDYENKGSYFVEGATGETSALLFLEVEYPECAGEFKPKDARLVEMAMCLDCHSWWVGDDQLCGECGEDRLSKKYKDVYWFMKKDS